MHPLIARSRAAILAGLLSLPGGCAAPQTDSASSSTSPGFMTTTGGNAPGTVNMPFIAAGENGLEVRQWVLNANAEQVASTLMRYREGEALSQRDASSFAHNGLRLVRVPLEELESLLSEIGASTRNVATWYGQATEWRDVLTSPVDETSRSLVVDGRVRRFSDGHYNLMLRSWTLMMEDAPRVQLDLIAQHLRKTNERLPLLAERRSEATWLHSVRAELLLEHGYAYVMVFESPGVEWREPGVGSSVRMQGDQPAPDHSSGAGVVAQPVPGSDRGSVGPFHDTGLGALAPATLGEVLLGRYSGQPKRHLLAFVPRIPPRLFPTVATSSAAGVDGAQP